MGSNSHFNQQNQLFSYHIDTKKAIMVTAENVKALTASLPIHAKSALRTLVYIKRGSITLQLPNGKVLRFDSKQEGPNADLVLHNWNPPRKALLGGTIGIAESYMDQDWDSSDVTKFLELFIVNSSLGNKFTTPTWLSNLLERLRHWKNKNSKSGSKRNISAHYDLGNDFYEMWLDKSMTYSSALFTAKTNSLEAAQEEKYRKLS